MLFRSLNIALALTLDPKMWAAAMSTWGTASKFGLFLIQYGTMRFIGVRRRKAQLGAGEPVAASA